LGALGVNGRLLPGPDLQERIQIWERLHALRLPRAPDHVLVQVIARQTRLSIGQVQDEQQRRVVGTGAMVIVL